MSNEPSLRERFGTHLKNLRVERGLTQRQLARLVNLIEPQIATLEAGRWQVQSKQWPLWADTLGVGRTQLGKLMLLAYDPDAFLCIFGHEAMQAAGLTGVCGTAP
jgi:transcriptional regulator with XRE-family HTH domain